MSTSTIEADGIRPALVPPRPFEASSVNRHVWSLAVPAVGESLLSTILLIVDTLMIAHYGAVPVAAAAVAGVILWRSHMVLSGIEKGTTAMVARYVGEGNSDRAANVVAQAIYLALAIGTLVSVVGVAFSREFFVWMKAASDVVEIGVPYITVIFLASIPRMLFFVAAGSFRGAGDTRSPMWVALWMNVLNIAFNYVLIYGKFGFPELRLLGSGISTCISLYFAAAAIMWYLAHGRTCIHLKLRHFRPDFKIMKTIFRIAIPNFMEEIIISVGYLAFIAYIARLGTSVLAAHSICTRIEALSFMAGFGFAIAAGTMVGQSLGMRSISLANLSLKRATAFCVLVMSAIAVILILLGDPIVRLFTANDEYVANLAFILLLIAAIEQPMLGITMTMSGGIRGAGDTVSPMVASIVGNILIRMLLAGWFAFGLGWGIYGIYLATMLDWITRSAILFYFYRRGNWSKVRI